MNIIEAVSYLKGCPNNRVTRPSWGKLYIYYGHYRALYGYPETYNEAIQGWDKYLMLHTSERFSKMEETPVNFTIDDILANDWIKCD